MTKIEELLIPQLNPDIIQNALVYLASPYSHNDKWIEAARFSVTEEFVAAALAQRYNLFSPIVYSHAMALKYKLPTDAEYWKHFNLLMLSKSTHLAVLCLNGWTLSKGVDMEITAARRADISVLYVEPPRNDL